MNGMEMFWKSRTLLVVLFLCVVTVIHVLKIQWYGGKIRGLNKATQLASARPRVLFITASQPGCSTPYGDYVTMRALKNKMDYAQRHGMDIVFSLELHVGGAHRVNGLHNKISVINNTIASHPDYDWYIWMDSDTIITDMDFEIPWEEYGTKSIVLWGNGTDFDKVAKESNYLSINTGVIFYRNSVYTRALFDLMTRIWRAGFDEAYLILSRVVKDMPGYPSDQSTLMYLLATQPAKWRNQTHFVIAKYEMNYFWKEVHLDNYYFSNWKGDGRSPPFVAHFCGCELCFAVNKNAPSCLAEFERAFNFADDQVLARQGLRHANLSTPIVVPVSDPMWYKRPSNQTGSPSSP